MFWENACELGSILDKPVKCAQAYLGQHFLPRLVLFLKKQTFKHQFLLIFVLIAMSHLCLVKWKEGTGSNPSSGKRFLLMEDCLYGDSNQDKIKWMREPASVLED